MLSVVMPVYNEMATLEECLERVFAVDLDLEVVAVNDGSDDGSRELLEQLQRVRPGLRVFHHDKRRGKGAALRTGFAQVRGDVVVIQDADLEYDPREYSVLLEPLQDGRADVVYGSRFLSGPHRVHLFLHFMGNRFLTFMSNLFTNLNLTDMETCYKAFRRPVVERLDLRSQGFSVEPEITAKVARMKARVYEVPISYSGRDFSEGKKIRWVDGVKALWAIFRFNLSGFRTKPLDR